MLIKINNQVCFGEMFVNDPMTALTTVQQEVRNKSKHFSDRKDM